MIFYFVRGHVGPLHKVQGYQRHRNVSKCRPHHIGDICTTRGNNLKTSFSYMSQNEQIFFVYYLGGGGGGPGGGLMSNSGERKFQGSKTSSQSRRMHSKANNHKFFIFGPQFYSTLVTSDILGPVKIEKFHCHLAGGANKMQQDK